MTGSGDVQLRARIGVDQRSGMTKPFPILGVDVEITELSASLTWEGMGVAGNIEVGD
jgi:hypothetical protein